MGRRDRALRRRRPTLEPRQRILIVCEGTRTEPGYFTGLRAQLRIPTVEIEVDDRGGVPRTLVQRAAERRRAADREAKRTGDPFLRFNEVWCVFDVDEHPNLVEALQQAKDNEIRIALSNPCFELWILLHFQEQSAHIDRGDAASACRRHLPGYAKDVTYAQLQGRYSDAVRRSNELKHWQKSRGCMGQNPSTDVDLLTELLHSLGRSEHLDRVSRLGRS